MSSDHWWIIDNLYQKPEKDFLIKTENWVKYSIILQLRTIIVKEKNREYCNMYLL